MNVPRARSREVATAVAASLVVVAVTVAEPDRSGPLLAALAVAAVAAVAALGDPVLAMLLVVAASFLRLAAPVDPLVPALGLAVVSVAAAVYRRHLPAVRCGPLEIVMLAYLGWNLVSWILPHDLPASGDAGWIARYLVTGTVLPFALYVLGRTVFGTDRAIRLLLWTVVGLAGYSALVSVLQFHGPRALVWPRFVVTNPGWPDRAVGVVNQPVVTGMVLVVAVPLCLVLARRTDLARPARLLAAAVAVVSCYAIYLTHTRVVWLAFVLVLVLGAVIGGRALRRDHLTVLAVIVVAAVANWAAVSSSDRSAGGVGSTNEIMDRLNIIATGWWGFTERPLAGWGIGRFAALNTTYHQQWAPWVDWERGAGFASHENEIGILAELGLVGLLLWLTVLALVARRVWAAVRAHAGDTGPRRTLTLVAACALLTYLTVGVTVDARFLDLANALAFLLAGAATAVPVTAPSPAPDPAVVLR